MKRSDIPFPFRVPGLSALRALTLFWAALGGADAFGQTERLSVSFQVYALATPAVVDPQAPVAAPVFHFRSGTGWDAIRTEWGGLSEEKSYTGEGPVGLYRSKPAEEDPLPSPDLGFTPLEGSGRYLVFLLPKPDGGYGVFPVSLAPSEFPPEHVRFFNASNGRVALNVGGSTRVLKPGNAHNVPASEAKRFQLRSRIAARVDSDWRLVHRSSFAIDKSTRTIFLIHRRNVVSGSWNVVRVAGIDEGRNQSETSAQAENATP